MRDIVVGLDYVIHWKTKCESGFIGEILFVVRNKSGGSLSTPVGHLVGFVEPASECFSSYWQISMILRDEIRYNAESNHTYVLSKSAYANKLKYFAQKMAEFNQNIVRIHPGLPLAIKDTLIGAALCDSPLGIKIVIGKDKYVYSDVTFDFG